MLSHIRIRDFAIIEELELNLHSGMSVLTGETGAGKSILIDALGMLLGDRADSDVVRTGSKRADISASFELKDLPQAIAWLAENDLDDEGLCLIRRTIAAEGRSKGFINGCPVPMQSLRALGELLVDIHGQHEHQSLLRNNIQRELLDGYANHTDLLDKLATSCASWQEAQAEYDSLRQAAADRDARLELLRYQVQELDALAPRQGEFAELESRHARLANVGKLQETGNSLLDILEDNEDHTACASLSQAVSELDALREVDAQLGEFSDAYNNALATLQDANKDLRHYINNLDADPARLQEVESRLSSFLDLARKHNINANMLPEQLESLQSELDDLQHAETRLEGLQDEIDKQLATYHALARKLTSSRKKSAATLSERVTQHMQQLSMPGGEFGINLIERDQAIPTPTGMERIEFIVSANPGQSAKPLAKVASGGELSRISLAIQVVLAHDIRIPTLIFDEIDVGIGGGVAEIVGTSLRALADNRQILCVTHLPQVAAQAHHHLHVSKTRGKDHTGTSIELLDEPARSKEIARMLGGVEITKQTLAHAEEMLERAVR